MHRAAMYSAPGYLRKGGRCPPVELHGHQQGPRRRFVDAPRARHPRHRRELRLRHPEAGPRAFGRAARMDRRHALPGAAPPGAARLHRGPLAGSRRRSPAQVLQPHRPRAAATRRGAPPVAGRGRHPEERLVGAVARRPGRPGHPGDLTMAVAGGAIGMEEQIARWRSFLHRRGAIRLADVEELEDHLREQVAALAEAGLAEDEAFLVAVKRMGALDALSREFAREHSERLWKQLVMAPDVSADTAARSRRDPVVALALAVLAAVAVKVPELFGLRLDEDAGFYARNMSLFVLPLLTGYFAWKRGFDRATLGWMIAAFAAAAVFANAWPFAPAGYTE